MSFIDYYKVLDINSKASPSDIKKAFRLLAKKYHPDKNYGSATAQNKFIQVHSAYEILSDDKKRIEYNATYSEYYNTKSNSSTNSSETKEKEIYKPEDFLQVVKKMNFSVEQNYGHTNSPNLYSYVLELLSENNVQWLLHNKDLEINKEIVLRFVHVVKSIAFKDVSVLRKQLVKLADGNEFLNKKIESGFKRGAFISFLYPNLRALLIFGTILGFLIFSLIGSSPVKHYSAPYSPPSPDTVKTQVPIDFKKNVLATDQNGNLYQSEKTKMEDYADWDEGGYSTGNTPGCYSFKPKYDLSLDNELTISVGYNSSVAIKLINSHNGKCIRYVYISAGENYPMRNIPEGRYYTKIAYGKEWKEKYSNGKCKAKFTVNNIYKKGTKILDFFKIPTGTKQEGDKEYQTYDLPSFKLSLDVIVDNNSDKFQSNEIDEDDFDK
jgi:curved DNA-binding protein CbpA